MEVKREPVVSGCHRCGGGRKREAEPEPEPVVSGGYRSGGGRKREPEPVISNAYHYGSG